MTQYNNQKYPMSMIILHSLVAVAMIGALVVGWMLEDTMGLMPIHQGLGLTVLFLAIIRIINRFRVSSQVPESVNAKGSIQRILEKSIHGILYVTMIAVPVLGCMLANSKGYPANFFGLFQMPILMEKNPAISHNIKELHELGANVFFGALILHFGGALVHLIKDKSNVFKRMLPF